ncbi:MAG: coproporphyrinogen dehydrogenase HemZ [Christensenellales bacterium]|jgi:coproporphyrinogen dehydrogenase HemZ
MKIQRFDNELEEIFRAFNIPSDGFAYNIELLQDKANIILIYGDIYNTSVDLLSNLPELIINRRIKRAAKNLLYIILSLISGIKLPYGSLTGVRPTKLYYELMKECENPAEILINEFYVSEPKARLIERVISSQKCIYNTEKDKVDLFINIPVCASRCAYCSFLCSVLNKTPIDEYVIKLREDIDRAIKLCDFGKKVRAVYIGGGTPTSLSLAQLHAVLAPVSGLDCEITVEAGRPDSINAEKLKLLKDYNVTRISVNPQTLKDSTLELIGRQHTVKEFYDAFYEASKYEFDINADIIAMLPGETLEDFINTVKGVIALRPDNITVHTLSLKRGSVLKLADFDNRNRDLAASMIDYSHSALDDAGYDPYYMYRQKYMSGNLENTGYSRPDKQCVYNIDMMEETHSIIACGAGAISKRISGDRIDRAANAKDIGVYIERFEEIMAKREKLFINSGV